MPRLICATLPVSSLLLLLCACSDEAPPPADSGGVHDAAVDRAAPPADSAARDRSPDRAADAPGSPDRPPCTLAGVYSSSNAACNDCAEAECCEELNACFAAPECNDDYVNCTLACAMEPVPDAGVPACLDRCATEHAAGKALYDVAIGCAETRCTAACD